MKVILKDELNLQKVLVMIFLVFISTVIVLLLRQSTFVDIPPSPQARQKGLKTSRIKIIEFSDFACPACALAHSYLMQVSTVYKDELQINYRYFPLTEIHPNSFLAAVNAECSARQNKFWEFADILFKEQGNWANSKSPQDIFKDYAQRLGINLDEFEKCINDRNTQEVVNMDISYGKLKNIDATPTFFINNRRVVGAGQLMQKIRELLVK